MHRAMRLADLKKWTVGHRDKHPAYDHNLPAPDAGFAQPPLAVLDQS